MKRTEISSLYQNTPADGTIVTVAGWAKTTRDSKNIGFIELNDGSAFKGVQVVFLQEKISNYTEVAKSGVGTAFGVTGSIVLTPQAKQPFEINAQTIEILGECPSDYPLQKKRHTLEYLRTITHLRPRTNTFSAAFRVRSAAAYAIHKFFNENGFVYVNTPLITGSDCEGAGEMFRVTSLDMENLPRTQDGKVDYTQDFFNRPTNLTVSGQLEAEAMALAFGKVYTFGPTFRAENSNTARHAAEFWMIEPEIAFADLSDYMDLAEAMVKYAVNYVLETCP
ncbi:MAG: amino acid--tRNA ligase-related protein, partial [Oscillospiraceae bacterium]